MIKDGSDKLSSFLLSKNIIASEIEKIELTFRKSNNVNEEVSWLYVHSVN